MAEALALQFQAPTGDELRFEWQPDAFDALDASAPLAEPVWTLGGELDWDEVDAVRVLSARLGDGRRLAVVALRPAGASGHGDELVAGAIGDGESFAGLSEPLLSTEYGPDGSPRRLGLEVYPADDGPALRIAADVTAVTASTAGGVERIATALSVRDGAGEGAGAFDTLKRP
jgi:hypothetical protein